MFSTIQKRLVGIVLVEVALLGGFRLTKNTRTEYFGQVLMSNVPKNAEVHEVSGTVQA